jgi:hypothetical protein
MKYLKSYKKPLNRYIFLDSEDKTVPDNYKYNFGDYVKCVKFNEIKHKKYWKDNGFDENSICIICVIDRNPELNIPEQRGFKYCIIPIQARYSSFELFVNEEDIIPATDYEIAVEKYNL